MKVQNMTNSRGNTVKNQFIIEDSYTDSEICHKTAFQSYNSMIAEIVTFNSGMTETRLDRNTWDYSATTGKYRNQFLNEGIAETRKKIASGEYVLTDLNGG